MAAQIIMLPQWNQAQCVLCDYKVTSGKSLTDYLAHYNTHHPEAHK